MDINSLINTLTTAIVGQSDIITWSQDQYGTIYNVFENVDLRNPPDEADCPMVVISHGAKTGGMGTTLKSHTIGADILVYDERITTQANGVKRYEGGRQAEILRQLVLEKIVAVIPANLQLDSVHVSYDPLTQFPYIFIDMELTITEPFVIGSNPYE